MRGRRTEGRHLRFARPEVVRFLREMGHPVPRYLGMAPPRAVLDANGPRAAVLARALGKSCEVARCPGLFACSLSIAAGQHEMVILDLDLYTQTLISDFVRAVRCWGVCEQLCLVGVSAKPASAREFLRVGGDAVLDPERSRDLAPFVRWLVGSERACPEGVRVRMV
jgi:hypothetical protein